jgi:predicted N-acetyltransferase YhbS
MNSSIEPQRTPGIMNIRRASEVDLQAITRIQGECYSGYFIESADSFAAKLSADSEFSFMAVQGDHPVAYVVAFPWIFGDVPELNGLEYAIPQNADGLYLHDISVSPLARKSGIAKRLLNTVLNEGNAKGYKQVFLVAIHGAASYWSRYGFKAVQADAGLQQRLSPYGEGATYMARSVE